MRERVSFYIHLTPSTMKPCYLTKEARRDAERGWLCTGCRYPKPGTEKLDVQIQEKRPGGAINFLFAEGVPLARFSFLAQLGSGRVRRDLMLGRVRGPTGTLLDDWATYWGRHRLIVRGSEKAQHRKCRECGRNLYFAIGTKYLYPSPPEGAMLFQDQFCGLILPESLWNRLGIEKVRGVRIERLPVLNKPLDGFPPLS